MSRLVMAAFWTEEADDDAVVDTIADALEGVAVKGHGGVCLLSDPPDRELRQMLRAIPGLEDAASTPACSQQRGDEQ